MPRRGWTVIPIFGRSSLTEGLRSTDERTAKLGFDLRKLFRSPLNFRSFEPILRGEEPVAPRVDQDYGDREDGVVERLERVAWRELREDEQDRDEYNPDHRDPADDVAVLAEMPGATLELLTREQPKQDGDAVGDVEADHGDGRHGGVSHGACLLYTSDAADDLLCVDLGGRRIIKKK